MRHNWHILNFGKIIEALMCVKNSIESLEEGSLMLRIKKYDGNIELCKLVVRDGDVKTWTESMGAEKMNAGDCERDVAIGLLEAEEALFSAAVNYRSYGLDGGLRYKNWFPLPLCIDENDAC